MVIRCLISRRKEEMIKMGINKRKQIAMEKEVQI
jgi:hypothetical protein